MSSDHPLSFVDLPPTVDADWLRRTLDRVVVADVRWHLDGRSGREAYLAGHIPGPGSWSAWSGDPPARSIATGPLPAGVA